MPRRTISRREFLAACAVLAVGGPAFAAADEPVTYSPQAFDAALASGRPFLLDFFAPW